MKENLSLPAEALTLLFLFAPGSNLCCQLCMLSVFPFHCVEDKQDFNPFICVHLSCQISECGAVVFFNPIENYEDGSLC